MLTYSHTTELKTSSFPPRVNMGEIVASPVKEPKESPVKPAPDKRPAKPREEPPLQPPPERCPAPRPPRISPSEPDPETCLLN